MDEEDLLPRSRQPEPRNLEVLSIEALGQYIAELEAEIARAQAEIEAKQAHRSGAEAVFRK